MKDAEDRRKGISEDDIERIAAALIIKMQAASGECKLTESQQQAVIDLITQKKKVVRFTLYIIVALFLWVLKDIYQHIAEHITWMRA